MGFFSAEHWCHFIGISNNQNQKVIRSSEEMCSINLRLTAKWADENLFIIKTTLRQTSGFGKMDDIPLILDRTIHEAANGKPWEEISEEKKKKKMSAVKKRLNHEVTKLMTREHIKYGDTDGDIIRWLEEIEKRLIQE